MSVAPLCSCPVCGARAPGPVAVAHVLSDHPEVPPWVAQATAEGCSVFLEEDLADFLTACGSPASAGALPLVIDDERMFPWRAIYARSSAEAICWLAAVREAGGSLESIWLDHDLGPDRLGGEDTGMRVAAWMASFFPSSIPVTVHSDNEDGALEITERLALAGFRVRRVPVEYEGAYSPESAVPPSGIYPP